MKRNIINVLVGIGLGLLVAIYAINHKSPTPILVEAKTSEEVCEEENTTAMVEEVTVDIVAEPTISKMETTTEEPTTESLVNLGEFKLTAYCPCNKCSGQWGTQTSTGATATQGRTIAVDPNAIPYGTVVVINGQEYVAEDTGSAIKEKRIDIYFDSHEAALEFGVQYVEVYERR